MTAHNTGPTLNPEWLEQFHAFRKSDEHAWLVSMGWHSCDWADGTFAYEKEGLGGPVYLMTAQYDGTGPVPEDREVDMFDFSEVRVCEMRYNDKVGDYQPTGWEIAGMDVIEATMMVNFRIGCMKGK